MRNRDGERHRRQQSLTMLRVRQHLPTLQDDGQPCISVEVLEDLVAMIRSPGKRVPTLMSGEDYLTQASSSSCSRREQTIEGSGYRVTQSRPLIARVERWP